MTTSINPALLEMDPETLQLKLSQGSLVLVDVREPVEFVGERIQGAVNVPLSRFAADQLPDLPRGKMLVLQCQSGNRSGQAAQRLLQAGYGSVTHLQGGLNAWKAAGLPVYKGQNVPISIMRQVQITAGSLVVLGTVLGAFVSPAWLILSGFVGSGLVFAGVTNTCGMAMLLARMPWNQVK